MKNYLSVGLFILSCLVLMSCSMTVRSPMLNTDLTREAWMQEINTDPHQWTRGADRWFLTGANESIYGLAPYSAVIATTTVRVSNFSNIKVNGDFQVQIFGTYGNNTVYLYGPNDATRQLTVELRGDTLCLGENKKLKCSVRNVIVRIGVNQLHQLTQLGRGKIEGIQLRSNQLTVLSTGSGSIYLAGNLNLQHIVNLGPGCITVLGANTPVLDIQTNGTGQTNVCGNVGIRSIVHRGKNDVNIIGANSDGLRIDAKGAGKIGVKGIVDLKEVKVADKARVYVYHLASSSLYAYVCDKGRLGLAGAAAQVYIDAYKNACVGARNLCTRTAYVRAHDNAHINIANLDKIFAAATENGSIYIFGSPNVMSQFVSNKGSIIPVWSASSGCCSPKPVVATAPPRVRDFKGEG